MNNRIFEIAAQVSGNFDPEDCMVSEAFLEAYAEAIVRECANLVDEYEDMRNPASTFKRLLLEDFGVK